MYKVPDDSELASLVSRTVILICCSANQVIIHLDRGAAIIAEAPFEHRIGRSPPHTDDVPLSKACIFTLLEQQVVKAEALRDRHDLLVRFSNDDSLVFKSEPLYESFHLKIGDATHAV